LDTQPQGAIEAYDRALEAVVGNNSSGSSSSSNDGRKRPALRGEEKEEFVKSVTNRAMAFYKLGDFTKCIADCTTALALEPGHGKARCVWVCVCGGGGWGKLVVCAVYPNASMVGDEG
jgi:hypothetical protein